MKSNRVTLAAAACAICCALPARAADLSGTVTSATNGAPLQNIEIRLWTQQDKDWVTVQTTLTDSNGVWSMTGIPDGTYKVFARMGPGASGNWGDRWYDVAPPTSNGYVAEDADEITLTFADTLNGIDIQLDQLGGFDGRVMFNGQPVAGILVRGETAADPRIHHNDVTQTGFHPGYFYMRGMPAATDYRFIVRDLDGLYDTVVAEPFACTAGSVTPVPNFTLQSMPADPNGPNDDITAPDVDVSVLHMSPPMPWTAPSPNISPRNTGDTDWYCFQAVDGDRLILTAQSVLNTATGPREDPWMDPMIGFFDGAGNKLAEDDDSAPDSRGAQLDTGVLTAGRYCAVVTTYGDVNYTGTIQGSAGPYSFTIAMGNRRPSLSATIGGNPTPVPPATITLDEAQSVSIDLAYSDIDGDPLTPTVEMTDSAGNPVTNGVFTVGANNATFAWTADQTAAKGSPYTIRFTVNDGEFTETVTVAIAVNSVNLTPTMPVQVAPADGNTVTLDTPELVVDNATDGDGDPLTYEFELYYGDATTPAQTGSVPEGMGGQTTWVPDPIPENTHVRWRVRAFDGQTDSPYSMWTGEWTFFVDTRNDPPEAPVFLKPDDSETLNIRKPTCSATNPVDPEGDAVVLHFQLARNAQFTEGLIESQDIPVNQTGSSTMWNLTENLPWGTTWFARAYAKDARGGVSPMSDYHVFTIRANVAPMPPTLGAPFDVTCQNLELKEKTLASVTVLAANDPEMEPVTVQLRVLPGQGDPNTLTPLYDETQPQTSDKTVFDTSALMLEEDSRYRVQARAYDGTDYSPWSQCDFVVNAEANPDDGNNGNNGNGDGGNPSVKEGCGCAATDGSALSLFGALALVAAGMRRRRAA
ncbi:MAG: carboxypeptidase regulatory-like domain-containing protein [Myxococcaceae bacterium]|nr:carboxypeptidase regulatory-like domain-containing protein [Myxococcaceae bacterium]